MTAIHSHCCENLGFNIWILLLDFALVSRFKGLCFKAMKLNCSQYFCLKEIQSVVANKLAGTPQWKKIYAYLFIEFV
jgi:hypothetical protein